MSDMNIRPYCDYSDRAMVTALWRTTVADASPHNDPERSIDRKRATQPELFLVAEVDGRVVGTAMGGYDGHRGWIYSVAVDAAHRRRGIATALIRRVERAMTELGCPKVNLQVRATNVEVVRFYEAIGYRVEERISMGKVLPTADV
jgi:ribosomal protein S18 acetylase RimI-like enzyme